MYKLLGELENTKTKQNHIGMYDGKTQPDELEDKRRCRNYKSIMGQNNGEKLYLFILHTMTVRVHIKFHNKCSLLCMIHNSDSLIVKPFQKYMAFAAATRSESTGLS